MGIKIIKGDINSGRSTLLLERFSKKPLRSIYILPNQTLANDFKERYLNRYSKTILGDRFIHWNLFVKLIARFEGYLLEPTDTTLLMTKLMDDFERAYFKHRTTGYLAHTISQTTAALKRNFITPDRLEDILSKRGGPKEFDLLRTYNRYEEHLEKLNLKDTSSLPSIAIDMIRSKRSQFMNNLDQIFIDEFILMNNEMIRILAAIKSAYPNIDIYVSRIENERFPKIKTPSLRSLDEISDGDEQLDNKDDPTSIQIPIVTRSPSSQLSFVKKTIFESLGSSGNYMIVLRRGSPMLSLIMSMLSLQTGQNKSNPVIATLFDRSIRHLFPKSGSIDEFIKLTKEIIGERDDADFDIQNSTKKYQLAIARSVISLNQIDLFLERLKMNSDLMKIHDINADTFIELLKQNIENQMNPVIAQAGTNLKIRFFEDGVATKFEQLIIPDCTDGNYPKASTQRLFFSEPDSLNFEQDPLIEDIFPNRETDFAREFITFHTFTQKCVGEALLSYPVITSTGKENAPSLFIEKTDVIDPPEREGFNITSDIEFKSKIEQERISKDFKTVQFHGKIENAALKKKIRSRFEEEHFSATRLEQYAKCPFMFFVEKVLNLKPLVETTPDIQPHDNGSIIHRAIEMLYRDHWTLLRSFDDKLAIREAIDKLVETTFEEMKEKIKYAKMGLVKIRKKMISELIYRLIESEFVERSQVSQPLTPSKFELDFGKNGKEALKIDIKDEKPAFIDGQIDRIDLTEDGARFMIVDYKSGKVESVMKKIEDGKHLQLPIYIRAANLLFYRNALALGGVLASVILSEKKHGILLKNYNGIHYDISTRSKTLTKDEDFERIIDNAFEHAGGYINKIREGEFVPNGADCPIYCKYEEVCRKR
ncbi:MAG: PD-(D/E)XK nuclease family protein [Pseudomonadota bacterium]